jgi:hypothetical protein
MNLGWKHATCCQRVEFLLRHRYADVLFSAIFGVLLAVSFWCSVLTVFYLERISRDTRELRGGYTEISSCCSSSNHPSQKGGL